MDEVALFIKQLHAKSTSKKIEAIRALGEFGDKRAIEPLLESLRDESWQVRKEVSLALSRIDGDEVIKRLIHHISDPDPNVRNSALEALELIGEKVCSYLANLLSHKDPDLRIFAANALGRLKDKRALPKILERIEVEDDENVRFELIEACGKIQDKRATEQLLRLLEKADTWQKFPIISALSNIADERATPYLMECLREEELLVITVEALGRCGYWACFPKILEIFVQEEDPSLLREYLLSLYRIFAKEAIFHKVCGFRVALDEIENSIKDVPLEKIRGLIKEDFYESEEEFILSVLFFMKHAKPEGNFPFAQFLKIFYRQEFEDEVFAVISRLFPYYKEELLEFLMHDDLVIVSGVVKSISIYQEVGIKEKLLALLENTELREYALFALSFYSNKEILDTLFQYLKEQSWEERKPILGCLSVMSANSKEIKEIIESEMEKALFSGNDLDVASSLLFFSLENPTKISKELLLNFLKSENDKVKLAALYLLSSLPSIHKREFLDEEIESIIFLVTDDDYDVRFRAIDALSFWLDRPFVKEAFFGILCDPIFDDFEKSKALGSLRGFLTESDKDFLIQRVSSFSPILLLSFLEVVRDFRGDKEFIKVVRNLLFKFGDDEVDANIVETLGYLGDKEKLFELFEEAFERGWFFLSSYIKALSVLKDAVAKEKLLEISKRSIGEDVVISTLISSFSDLLIFEAIPFVAYYLDDSEHFMESCFALSKFFEKDPKRFVTTEVKDAFKTPSAKRAYLFILASYKEVPEFKETISQFLNDPFPSVREVARIILEQGV